MEKGDFMSVNLVRDSSSVHFNEMPQTEQKDQEARIQPIEDQTTTNPAESKNALLAKEAMHQATSPALRLLEQDKLLTEKLMKITTIVERFPLMLDLFKVKIELYKQAGGSLDDLVKEFKEKVAKKDASPFAGNLHELKQDLCQTYTRLQYDANQMTADNYCSPFVKMYELEKETGFVATGANLFLMEISLLITIEKTLWQDIMNASDEEAKYKKMSIFCGFQRINAVSTLKQILAYAEQAQDRETIKICLNHFCRCLDKYLATLPLIPIYGSQPFLRALANLQRTLFADPHELWDGHFAHFLPHLAKYDSVSQVKNYFNTRWEELPSWERSYKWVDLCCQAAEMVAKESPAKAKEHIALAEKEVSEQLWAYCFSPNKEAILQKQKEANERIAKVTLPQQGPAPSQMQ
jgi:hypothetical protein